MEKQRVAVIGAGPSGLTMLKALREDGFTVTLYTTALPITQANISKFTCGFSDFPIPDKYPTFLHPHHFQEYMEDYAKHFDLLKDIVFNAEVKLSRRNQANTHWLLDVKISSTVQTVEYDRIAFCHGYQTKPEIPIFPGQDLFQGPILHSQAFRSTAPFSGKKVVVVGLSSSAGDIIPALMPVASKVYVSHRRGTVLFKRYRNGYPTDLVATWRRRQLTHFLQRRFPRFSRWLADVALALFSRTLFGKLDPAWNLDTFPSISTNLPGSIEYVMPFLQNGSLTSLRGLKQFVGPTAVELDDGTVVDDVDAVVLCTGYSADWSVAAPWVEKTKPRVAGYHGQEMYRLWMNLFPPAYADSCVMLCWSSFGKNNGFSFADVTAWAVSAVWRGVEKIPEREEMEKWVDRQHRWVVDWAWKKDPLSFDASMVRQWEFQGWLHQAAGTGMENLGWGWKGWKFWWKDRKMYSLMNHGVETAHGFRFFDGGEGRRRKWEGARKAIVHMNEQVKTLFPVEEEEIKTPEFVM
ncbi:hypothetical protein OQA88_8211 [Cercophora sp. LCS_1]